jgi:hypothetical protein
VFDGQAVVLRHFDAEGRFLRQVGRRGQGPGEYEDAVLGMAVRRDGRLQIRDARNGRVTLYEPDGAYAASWPVASSLFTSDAMFLDTADHTYLKVLQGRPQEGESWRIGLLHLDESGAIVDTVPDPEVADSQPTDGGYFNPAKQWTFAADGSIVVGVSDRYRFEVRRPDGTVLRVERVAEPVPVLADEHAAFEAQRAWLIEQGLMATLPGPTARVKPFFRRLYTDTSGRIWVWIHRPAERLDDVEPAEEGRPPPIPFTEPRVFDVFEGDGTYLGQVHVPRRVNVLHFGADTLWGVRRGELGESYVVRLRLEPLSEP